MLSDDEDVAEWRSRLVVDVDEKAIVKGYLAVCLLLTRMSKANFFCQRSMGGGGRCLTR